MAPPHPGGVGVRRRGRPDGGGLVPPAVPGRPLLVGLPGVPGPRGQRQGRGAARRGGDRRGGERGKLVAVPPRADHLRDHLPPPPSQVLRRASGGLVSALGQAAVSCSRAGSPTPRGEPGGPRRHPATQLARVESSSRHCSSVGASIKTSCRAMDPVCGGGGTLPLGRVSRRPVSRGPVSRPSVTAVRHTAVSTAGRARVWTRERCCTARVIAT